MFDAKRILRVMDAENRFCGVFIPADEWTKIASAPETPDAQSVPPDNGAEAGFEALMRHWDFPYPYDPATACPHCGASARNWRDGGFELRNANLGGLLVFKCRGCGATIRHKYFKDRMAVECDPA